jgi:hypothetical protein
MIGMTAARLFGTLPCMVWMIHRNNPALEEQLEVG